MSDESMAEGTNETRFFRLQFDMGKRGYTRALNSSQPVPLWAQHGTNTPHTQVSRYQDYFSCVYDLYDGSLFARL